MNVTYSRGNSQVLWEDGERVFSRGWRVDDDGNRLASLLVTTAADHPPPSTLDRLAHEYELRNELDKAWAAQPLALMRDAGHTVLVLEDVGGEPLDHLLTGSMELPRFLRLAIAVTSALGKLHHCGLVHKDIKPTNILLNEATGEVRLTGFGIASRFARERQSPHPPETIAGTLAYMAPEQTGRMHRSIDSRCDIYALGVTLYQMLTGVLPLTATDPMEWVHCHIAKKPIPPRERLEGVPAPISAIIMKLLAKAPEDRYQTAGGAERDLRRCLAEWETYRRIDDFPLGLQDTPNRLLIPEKLYGRDREIETLFSCLDRVIKTGVPELVLVSGYSGIGKSSIIDELHRVLVQPRALFACGKFDQQKRDVPYATLVQAIQSLLGPLLSKSDTEFESWRRALLEALGSNGRLMIDLIPELKLIIGDQPPVPEMPPQLAQSRFQLVFRRFIGAFARPNQPLVLFLDDLQWLDPATLEMLKVLLQHDLEHLILIGAYRDNEVAAAHPLIRTLSTIKAARARVTEIKLSPLSQEQLGQLVADTLRCEVERTKPFTKLVHAKTGGNPFFAIQFLSSLVDEGLLTFDDGDARWSWDINGIHAKGYTDNVVDLMVKRLTRLPAEAQNVLRQLSCLGNSADSAGLSMVLGISECQLDTILQPARQQELVERVAGGYRFVHDRVQEAAYGLIPGELRREAHLRVGRLLAAHTPPEKLEKAIFDIVCQLNRGAHLMTSMQEREQLAELNWLAGERAKASTAYISALNYLTAGAALLGEDCWVRQRDLIFAIELNRAECEFLTGALTKANHRLEALSERATGTVERATVACLRINLYVTLDESPSAVTVGLDFLRHLGIEWSPHPTAEEVSHEYQRIWATLGSRPIESIVELPLLSDPTSLAILDVLTKLALPALYTDANLLSLVSCRAVNLSLEGGNCDASGLAYSVLGFVAGPRFGDYHAGFRFGQLGYDLVEKRGLNRFQSRIFFNFGSLVIPWTKHIRGGRDLIRRALETANRSGDLNFEASCYAHLNTNLLAAGEPLDEVQREAERALTFALNMRSRLAIDRVRIQLGLVRTLRGLTPTFGSFDEHDFDEQLFERDLASNPGLALAEGWYWIRKMQARFFANDNAGAIEASGMAQRLLWTSPSMFETAEFGFYGALAHAAAYDRAPSEKRSQHLDALVAHHKQIEVWAESCTETFENRAALVGAEIARIEGRAFDAMNLYEKAIHSAQRNGFVHNEALANELAARFHKACGFEQITQLYLQNARDCYLRWGANGKVRQLDSMYPRLRTNEPAPASTGTIAASVDQLDLTTVIKVSQSLSGEIVLEKLLESLMRLAVEHAGAERGLLILSHGSEQRIAAEAKTNGDLVAVHQRDEPVVPTVLPKSVLQYVQRTRESVILDDASSHNPFSVDPYIVESQLRSILCLPLTNQGKLAGILYLENNLTPGAFSPNRVALLTVLASQAAISLENSRLYDELADREEKIRRLVDANIIGIFIADREGRILEANDAFLLLVGYSHDDLVSGQVRWPELTPPEWRERDALTQAELNSTGVARPFEKEYVRKDGSRVPVLVGAALFKDGGDRLAFVLDLTERKRVEEALSQAQRLSRTGNWIYDATTMRYLYWSEESYRIWGFDPLQGLPNRESMWDRIHPEDRDRVWAAVQAAVRENRDLIAEFRLLLPDGTIKWVEGTSYHVFSPRGTLAEVITTTVDVTERRRAQDEREKLRQLELDFAHVNRVSTMGELAASLSHEILHPIATARNNARAGMRFLAMNPPNLAEVREALSCVVRDADRARDIVGRMRDHVKKAPPRKERFDLNAAIHEVLVLAQSVTQRNGVSVRTHLADGSLPILGDRIQLQQVLLNLIINATEAMSSVDEGAKELFISTGRDETGTLVAVRDLGLGIDAQHLDRVFDAFYTTKSTGTGMGLSICRSIIHAHGGRLWAEANEPRGAVFQFTLPADNGS